MSNTFGDLFRITSFGESHGEGLGVVVDGMPSGIPFDMEILQDFLSRRRPGGEFVSSRKEKDQPQILSGVYEGLTLGTPITCVFKNTDAQSGAYKSLKPRRGHADLVWKEKYHHVDLRGGGRSSGRETLARVVGGACAKMVFQNKVPTLNVKAVSSSIYNFKDKSFTDNDFFSREKTHLGFLSTEISTQAEEAILKAKNEGESFGGRVELRAVGVPKSLGQPVFKKIKARFAEAVMSVGAVKSFSLGDDVDFSCCKGRQYHSMPHSVYGGVSGGITTGETIKLYADIKPTSSILDVAKAGRHDPCIVPRVLVVLESMIWVVLMDMWMYRKLEVV